MNKKLEAVIFRIIGIALLLMVLVAFFKGGCGCYTDALRVDRISEYPADKSTHPHKTHPAQLSHWEPSILHQFEWRHTPD